MASWDWTQLVADGGNPGDRTEIMGAYDTSRSVGLIYGGAHWGDVETWKWNGSIWTLHSGEVSPGNPYGNGTLLCYDTANHRIILYSYGTGTWHFGGSEWSHIATVHDPSNPGYEEGRMMCFDEFRGNVVYFNSTNHTWIFNGTDWIEQSPSHSPTVRTNGSMAYDPISQTVILFGGVDTSYYSDTWSWDGTDWTQLSPSTTPHARQRHNLVLARNYGRIVLVGGWWENPSPPYNNYTTGIYSWDGEDWVQEVAGVTLNSSNPGTSSDRSHARYRAPAFYDDVLGGIIISCGTALTEGDISSTIFLETPNATPPPEPSGGMSCDWISGSAKASAGFSLSAISLGVAIKDGRRPFGPARKI
jgi:hypothetical protein